MHEAHTAALTVIRESLTALAAAVGGLPDDAMSWTPAPNTNSLAVLVHHSLTATRFLLGNSAGQVVSITTYRQTDRADSFKVEGETAATLGRAISGAIPEFEAIAARGSAATLEATVSFPEDASATRTGYGYLFHSIAHLREHVGQAQLMRDLWAARGGA